MSESHKPLPLVVECAELPVQVHLTWSFTFIFTLAGLKPKSMIFTLVTAARHGRAQPKPQYPRAKNSGSNNCRTKGLFFIFSGALADVCFSGDAPAKVRCFRPAFVPEGALGTYTEKRIRDVLNPNL